MRKTLRDVTGCRFGALVVRGRIHTGQRWRWLCECDCGKTAHVEGYALRKGKAVSCGCYRRAVFQQSNLQHGGTGTRAFGSWAEMRRRCSDPRRIAFKNYGGRGITVCSQWKDYKAFLADMGPCPEGLSLDRINNELGYEPGNCRWATRAEQSRNHRRNVFVNINGERLILADACARYGQPWGRVRDRMKVLGWTAERALTTPKWGSHVG